MTSCIYIKHQLLSKHNYIISGYSNWNWESFGFRLKDFCEFFFSLHSLLLLIEPKYHTIFFYEYYYDELAQLFTIQKTNIRPLIGLLPKISSVYEKQQVIYLGMYYVQVLHILKILLICFINLKCCMIRSL